MKTYLLPHYSKWISLLILASSALFLYLHSATGMVVAIIVGILGWLCSAERIEDERTAQQRLLAIRASAIATVLFGTIFALLVAGGFSASPSLFCVAPISLLVYVVTFYGSLFVVTNDNREE